MHGRTIDGKQRANLAKRAASEQIIYDASAMQRRQGSAVAAEFVHVARITSSVIRQRCRKQL
jgi:hypothetical protein